MDSPFVQEPAPPLFQDRASLDAFLDARALVAGLQAGKGEKRRSFCLRAAAESPSWSFRLGSEGKQREARPNRRTSSGPPWPARRRTPSARRNVCRKRWRWRATPSRPNRGRRGRRFWGVTQGRFWKVFGVRSPENLMYVSKLWDSQNGCGHVGFAVSWPEEGTKL